MWSIAGTIYWRIESGKSKKLRGVKYMSSYILPEIPDRWDNIINQYDFIREALVMNIFDVDFKQLRLLSFEEDERTLVKEVKRIKE